MKNFRILFLCIFSFFIQNTNAQYNITKDAKDKELIVACIDSIYDFRFEKAEKLYLELRKKYPTDPSSFMLEQLSYFWQIIPMNPQHPQFQYYTKLIKKTIELSEPLLKVKETEAEATFYMLSSYASMVLVYSKLKENGKIIGAAKQSYQLIKRGFELKKNVPDFHYSTGMFNFYVEQIPENIPFIKPFMFVFPSGSKAIGIKEFELGAEKGLFSKPQCTFLLPHLYTKYENKHEKALPWVEILNKKYPQNLLFRVQYFESLFYNGLYDRALAAMKPVYESKKQNFIFSAELFTGLILVKSNGDLKLAKAHLYHALKICYENKLTTSDHYGLIYWGLAMVYEKEKNKLKTEENYKKALSVLEYSWLKREIAATIKKNKIQ